MIKIAVAILFSATALFLNTDAEAQTPGCSRKATLTECIACAQALGWKNNEASPWCRRNWRAPAASRKRG
jgi:hypothetical protein